MSNTTLILRAASALRQLRAAQAADRQVASAAAKIREALYSAFLGASDDNPDNYELLRLANQANRLAMQCKHPA